MIMDDYEKQIRVDTLFAELYIALKEIDIEQAKKLAHLFVLFKLEPKEEQ